MNGDAGGAAGFCAGLPRPVRVAYEAGPTGYGLARELAKRGVECVVAAPSKIPRASGDRVKTDRRDAEHLVRLLLAGKLHAVRVPGLEEEALRDLVRAREPVRVDLMRCRHRLSKLLLRHGIRFDDGNAWTERHRGGWRRSRWSGRRRRRRCSTRKARSTRWLTAATQLEREIVALLPGSPWAVQVGRLRCLRGVDTLTAVGLCAEIGDFERFARAEQLMSYVGLVPSESHDRAAAPARVDHEDRVRARPAAAGRSRLALPPAPARSAKPSPTARTTSHPRRSRSPGQRNSGCTAPGHASKQRAKRRTIIAVAAARELAGFCWAICQIE